MHRGVVAHRGIAHAMLDDEQGRAIPPLAWVPRDVDVDRSQQGFDVTQARRQVPGILRPLLAFADMFVLVDVQHAEEFRRRAAEVLPRDEPPDGYGEDVVGKLVDDARAHMLVIVAQERSALPCLCLCVSKS